MTPFSLYRLYLSIRLHFSSERYDAIESKGRVRCSEESFSSRNNMVTTFKILSNQIKDPQSAVQFFFANELYSTPVFETTVALSSYKTWLKHKEMLTQLVLDDIDILEQHGELDDAFSGEVPVAVKLMNRGEIHIESLVAINKIIGFTQWSNWKENLCFPKLALKLNKAGKFVRFNEERVKRRLYESSKVPA